jgi:hypothetical protein
VGIEGVKGGPSEKRSNAQACEIRSLKMTGQQLLRLKGGRFCRQEPLRILHIRILMEFPTPCILFVLFRGSLLLFTVISTCVITYYLYSLPSCLYSFSDPVDTLPLLATVSILFSVFLTQGLCNAMTNAAGTRHPFRTQLSKGPSLLFLLLYPYPSSPLLVAQLRPVFML